MISRSAAFATLVATASIAAVTQRADAQSAAAVAQGSGQLEEIMVTAQRRSENLQDVPIAVTAYTAGQMESTGVDSTVQLIDIVPALTYSNTVGLGQLHIRGIGNTSQGAGVENSVATYVDGVYISSVPGSLLNVSNVDHVEVLKGPQGTLFGRNATGGLMQIVTKDPGDHFSGNASVNIGDYDVIGANLYVTGPITPILGADLMVSVNRQGTPYGENIATGNPNYQTPRDVAARSKWVLHPSDTTTVRLAMDYEDWFTIMAPTIIAGTAPAATGVIQFPTSPYDSNFNAEPSIRTTAGGLGVKVDQELGPVSLASITSYRTMDFKISFDADFSTVPKTIEAYTQKDTQVTQEFQLTPTHAGALQWMVGFFYFHWDSSYDPLAFIFGAPPTNSYTFIRDTVTTQSFAGFGQATYEILPQTHITAGIRYTADQRNLSGDTHAIAVGGATTVTGINQPELTTHVPTWRVSLDHKFDNDILTYVSYNRGYKSGGYIATSPATPAYKPEYLDAYEIGEKSQWLNNRLRINAAAFLYNYKDIQVNSLVGSVGIIYNGAKAREYGLDIDTDFRITDDFSLIGSAVWNHDRFTSFPNAVIARPLANGLVSNTLGSAEGNELPFAPTGSASLGFDYKFHLASAGTTDLVLNDLYSTGFYGQVDNYLRQPGYHMLNGSLNWKPLNGNFNVMLWANNMLNRNVATYLQAATAQQIVQYQPPRTFGVRLGVQF